MGAKHGILFKTAACLEEHGHDVQIVALDKTGTITVGRSLSVTDLVPGTRLACRSSCCSWPAALEQKSEHPLAQAITQPGRRTTQLPTRGSHRL